MRERKKTQTEKTREPTERKCVERKCRGRIVERGRLRKIEREKKNRNRKT